MQLIPVSDNSKHKPETAFKHTKDVEKCAKILVYLDKNGDVIKIVKNFKKPLDLIVFLAPIPFGKTKDFFILFEIGFGKHRPYFCAPNFNGRYVKGISRITGRIKLFTLDKESFNHLLPQIALQINKLAKHKTSHWKHQGVFEKKTSQFYANKYKKTINFKEKRSQIISGPICSVSVRDQALIDILRELELFTNEFNQRLARQVAIGINHSLNGYDDRWTRRKPRHLKGCQNMIDLLSKHEHLFKKTAFLKEMLRQNLIYNSDFFLRTLFEFKWISFEDYVELGNVTRLSKNNDWQKKHDQTIAGLKARSNNLQIRTRPFGWQGKPYVCFEIYLNSHLKLKDSKHLSSRHSNQKKKKEVVPF